MYTKTKISDIKFLEWITNRLNYKYSENTEILDVLKSITSEKITMPKDLDNDMVEKCCRKHFFDFDMEKSEDFRVGYTEDERNDIRKLITDIYSTIKEYQCQN